MRSIIAWLVSAAALRPPGRRPKPTAKPFAPDTDALDDFFTQLDPDAARRDGARRRRARRARNRVGN